MVRVLTFPSMVKGVQSPRARHFCKKLRECALRALWTVSVPKQPLSGASGRCPEGAAPSPLTEPLAILADGIILTSGVFPSSPVRHSCPAVVGILAKFPAL